MTSPPDITVRDLVQQLAGTLGDAKAEEVVSDALRITKTPAGALNRQQAIKLLDQIATHSGIVGITASFVKSRLLLNG